MVEPVAMCFSGGKDCTLALRAVQQGGRCEVVELLTTMTTGYDRVSMHGVRRALLRAQSEALGIPVTEVQIPRDSSNDDYERAMGRALTNLRGRGIRRVVFGDIFLEDLRAYRERQLARLELEAIFPLWRRNTTALASTFIRDGFAALVVCVDPRALDSAFAGRRFDERFLSDLPPTVDPCGENGEFHSFVSAGPMLSQKINVRVGETVERDGFAFADLVPG